VTRSHVRADGQDELAGPVRPTQVVRAANPFEGDGARDLDPHAGAVPAEDERRLTQDPGRPVPLPGLPADGVRPGGADADPDLDLGRRRVPDHRRCVVERGRGRRAASA
jgi:hypothetical protein